MKTKILTLFLFASILFLSACTSHHLKLKPLAEEKFWEQGREYAVLSDEQMRIYFCLENCSNTKMVYYLEVKNLSDTVLEVNPKHFYYSYLSKTKVNGKPEEKKVYAVNPETQITFINKKMYQETDEHLVSSTTKMGCGCLNLFGGMTSTVQGEKEEAQESFERADEVFEDMEEERIAHEQEMEQLTAERTHLEDEMLRRTTLTKDQIIGGFVEYPVSSSADRLIFFFPIGSSNLRVEYKAEWVPI